MSKTDELDADGVSRPAGTTDKVRLHSQQCAGKVAIEIVVNIDTREMSSWSAERIESLFKGIALVERAMAGIPNAAL